MKTVIIKNNTPQEIELMSLGGIVLDASGTRDISDLYFDLIVNSDDLRDAVVSGTITINDGTLDLATSRALTYISYEDAEYIQGVPVVRPEDATLSGGFTIRYQADQQNWLYDNFRMTELDDVSVDEDSGQYVVISPTTSGVLYPIVPPDEFVELLDTPTTYSGSAGSYVRVSTTESGLEFVSPETLEEKWFTHFINDTPSKKINIYGYAANGFNPGYDIRLLELNVQYHSDHATLSDIKISLYRYDYNATSNRLILSAQESNASVGYHSISDTSPDINYYDLDSSAGDTFWIEVEDTSGEVIKKTSEITISVKYKAI